MSDFQPMQYQQRPLGGSQRVLPSAMDVQAQVEKQQVGRRGVIIPFSTYFRMQDLVIAPGDTGGSATVFLCHPPDGSVQNFFIGWSKDKAMNSMQKASIAVYQRDESSGQNILITETGEFFEADKLRPSILRPADRVRPGWALFATLSFTNTTDPTSTAWWDDDELEVWMTLHFLTSDLA